MFIPNMSGLVNSPFLLVIILILSISLDVFFLLAFVDAVGSLAFGVVVSFAFAPYKSEKSLCCTLSSLDHQPQA